MCREVIEFRQHDSETFYFLANLKAGLILQYDGYIFRLTCVKLIIGLKNFKDVFALVWIIL